MGILVITSCGAKKNSEPMVAYKLYKSSRIRAVYNRRCGCHMAILSAKCGLIDSHQVIKPYDLKMNKARSKALIPSISKKLSSYDKVVFFAGGSNKHYYECLKNACKLLGIELFSVGYANMGDINKLPQLIRSLK